MTLLIDIFLQANMMLEYKSASLLYPVEIRSWKFAVSHIKSIIEDFNLQFVFYRHPKFQKTFMRSAVKVGFSDQNCTIIYGVLLKFGQNEANRTGFTSKACKSCLKIN